MVCVYYYIFLYHCFFTFYFRSLLKYDRAKLYNGSLETYHLLGFVDQEKQPKFNTKWLLHALERFFASDDDELSIYHVPEINEIVERDHDNECVDVGEKQRTEVGIFLQLHLYMYILLNWIHTCTCIPIYTKDAFCIFLL